MRQPHGLIHPNYCELRILRIAFRIEQDFGAIIFDLSGIGVVVWRSQDGPNVNFIWQLEWFEVIVFAIYFRTELGHLIELALRLQVEFVTVFNLKRNRFNLPISCWVTLVAELTCVMDPLT